MVENQLEWLVIVLVLAQLDSLVITVRLLHSAQLDMVAINAWMEVSQSVWMENVDVFVNQDGLETIVKKLCLANGDLIWNHASWVVKQLVTWEIVNVNVWKDFQVQTVSKPKHALLGLMVCLVKTVDHQQELVIFVVVFVLKDTLVITVRWVLFVQLDHLTWCACTVELPLALKETALATADRDFLENYARSGLFVIKEPMEKSAKITEHQQVQREIADVCVPLDTKDLTVRLSCHAQLV